MPYMRITYLSDWAGRKDVGVYYPQEAPSAYVDHTPIGTQKDVQKPLPRGGKYQMLWLIHDEGGNFTDWPLRADIERLCEEYRLFVVMPTVQDFVTGLIELGDFYQMVALELPELMNNLFPVSPAREDNFLVGCGFGGYFAYRIAMNYPHRYRAAASFSGLLDVVSAVQDRHAGQDGFYPPEEMLGTEKDILHMARQNQGCEKKPALYGYCGDNDFSRSYGKPVHDALKALGYDAAWKDLPGAYGYALWKQALEDFLSHLPLAKAPVFPDPSIVLPKGGKPFYAD